MSFLFKKIFILNIISIILLSYNGFIYANDGVNKFDIDNIEKVLEISTKAIQEPKINSRHAIVLERNSKAILYGKNEFIKTKMASATKIMTAIVVIESCCYRRVLLKNKKRR